MSESTNVIRIYYTDSELNNLLASTPTRAHKQPYVRRFNYNEEYFLRLPAYLEIPSFRIHHDVREHAPESGYMEKLRSIVSEVQAIHPSVFCGLTYIFDPSDIFRPRFFRLYSFEDAIYLYLLELDLLFKPQYSKIIERGTNDTSHRYRTESLFLEAILIPLERVNRRDNGIESFEVLETIEDTWVGERGRGYFIQGIWIDNALSKFISTLFAPPGKSIYPVRPFLCKFKTICATIIDFEERGVERALPYLARVLRFIGPEIRGIEHELKDHDFSPELGIYKLLKDRVPDF